MPFSLRPSIRPTIPSIRPQRVLLVVLNDLVLGLAVDLLVVLEPRGREAETALRSVTDLINDGVR